MQTEILNLIVLSIDSKVTGDLSLSPAMACSSQIYANPPNVSAIRIAIIITFVVGIVEKLIHFQGTCVHQIQI